MTNKSIKKNYLYNLSYQLLMIAAPLITTPYLSRVLGADGVGTASYIDSIVSYFVLFATMGVSVFGQREISYIQDDRKIRSIIFWEIEVLELIATLVVSIIYFIFAINRENKNLYFAMIFNILSVAVNITWLFQGLEEFGKIVLRNFVLKLINIAYILIAVNDKADLIWYLFGISLFTFSSNLSLWYYVPKYIDRIPVKELRPFRHVSGIISLFIPTIAIQIYTVLDKTMIGLITNDSYENGYYEQALKVTKMLLTIVTSLGTVIIPRIGAHYEHGNSDEINKLMFGSYRFVWFIGIPMWIGLSSIAGGFVPWFFGEGYDEVVSLLKILSFMIVAVGISNVTGIQYMIPTKRQKQYTISVILGAGVNFFLNIFLISKLQSLGAAIASVIAESTVSVLQIVMVRKELQLKIIIKASRHYLIAGIVMAFIISAIGRVGQNSIVNIVLSIILGSVTYFGMLILFRDDFINQIFHGIKNKIK